MQFGAAFALVCFLCVPIAAQAEFYIDDAGRIYERNFSNQYTLADHRHPMRVYLPEDQTDELRPLEGSTVYVKPNRQAKVISADYSDNGDLEVIYSYRGSTYRTTAERISKATHDSGNN
jgi:hypothetical protein